MPRYRLAHPLDNGNRFLKGGAAAPAGDVVELHPSQAAKLGEAGYLNLDDAGKPLLVAAVAGDKPAKKTAAKKTTPAKPAVSEADEADEPDGHEPDDESGAKPDHE